MVENLGPEVVWKYFPDPTEVIKTQVQKLSSLYQTYNAHVNVISRRDIDQIYLHHVLHSLSLLKLLHQSSSRKVLDLGTGGGFPGIPLAIYSPDCHFTLIDGSRKKIRIVQQVIESLGLSNVEAHHMRAEDFQGSFDHIVCRAVASTKQLISWTRNLTTPNTRMDLLKGGDLVEELAFLSRNQCEVLSISDQFDETYFQSKKIVRIRFSDGSR